MVVCYVTESSGRSRIILQSYSQRHIEMGANVLADRLHRTEGGWPEGEVRRDH